MCVPIYIRLLKHQTPVSQNVPVLQPQRQGLHTSSLVCGLEEFFEDKKNLGEAKVKAGMYVYYIVIC